ncbi:MAG TPA: hypothetical protein VIJ95_00435 [Hanamia sp.]
MEIKITYISLFAVFTIFCFESFSQGIYNNANIIVSGTPTITIQGVAFTIPALLFLMQAL